MGKKDEGNLSMLVELQRITVLPGQTMVLRDVTWEEFERILEDLGEHRAARVAYDRGILEIMSPLPEHEDDKDIISDLIKILLEERGREFRCLGSTTFKNSQMTGGIEPDQCFYIEHEPQIRGKRRLDLKNDPPPDLALEIDVTSRTHPSIYERLGVPELWRFERDQLKISILTNGVYVDSLSSRAFPALDLVVQIPLALQRSRVVGRTPIMREFRSWVQAQLAQNN
jgi:Uma2 family endonuclease